MTPEQRALSDRSVRCKHFRWMPGMLALGPPPLEYYSRIFHPNDGRSATEYMCSPDLNDPATLGCLLSLVREAWKSPVAQLSPSLPDGYQWTCYINDEAEDRLFREKTEAEALIAALEAAP